MRTTTAFLIASATGITFFGPRPLFVRTAYAAPPVPQIEQLVTDALEADTCELPTIDCEGFPTQLAHSFGEVNASE